MAHASLGRGQIPLYGFNNEPHIASLITLKVNRSYANQSKAKPFNVLKLHSIPTLWLSLYGWFSDIVCAEMEGLWCYILRRGLMELDEA